MQFNKKYPVRKNKEEKNRRKLLIHKVFTSAHLKAED